jgi:hypothetical protein
MQHVKAYRGAMTTSAPRPIRREPLTVSLLRQRRERRIIPLSSSIHQLKAHALRYRLPVVSVPRFYIMNRSLGGVQCGVDVPKSAIPKTSYRWIVLFAIRIGPHFSQQIGSFVQAAAIVGG